MKRYYIKYFRVPAVFAALSAFLFILYAAWTPGSDPEAALLNRNANGMWISHGWIGDDVWFEKYNKDFDEYRSEQSFARLESLVKRLEIVYLFPHLCPTSSNGAIPGYNRRQIEKTAALKNVKILPWIGGVNGLHVHLAETSWRNRFTKSVKNMLARNPELAGVHINIEPLKSGTSEYINLLSEIRDAIGREKLLSIAAYPPPTFWQQVDEVHWSEKFYNDISEHVDQFVVMMYDTSIDYRKFYIHTYKQWVNEVLDWSGKKDVLFGIPAYEDKSVEYHNPAVENIQTAISGLSAGLLKRESTANYLGISIYAGWTLDENEVGCLMEAIGTK